jgi:hypothetical protein
MRNSYWRHIENLIFDIEINEPELQKYTQKTLFLHKKPEK